MLRPLDHCGSGLRLRNNLFDQPLQHVAGAHFGEQGRTIPVHLSHALGPSYGGGQLGVRFCLILFGIPVPPWSSHFGKWHELGFREEPCSGMADGQLFTGGLRGE